jgi:hypothetical protein
VIRGGTFAGSVERLFLSFGGDGDDGILLSEDDEIADNFDPQIARK